MDLFPRSSWDARYPHKSLIDTQYGFSSLKIKWLPKCIYNDSLVCLFLQISIQKVEKLHSIAKNRKIRISLRFSEYLCKIKYKVE